MDVTVHFKEEEKMISKPVTAITLFLDKTGTVAALTAAMGCASCFPALGSLASSIGLGVLAHYEGILVTTLLPLFTALVLLMNAIGFFTHKVWYRSLAGVTGPSMILLTLYPLWSYGWSTYLLYAGLGLMLVVSLWDIISPPHKISMAYLITTPVAENEFAG